VTLPRFLEQLHANIEATLDVDDDDTPMTVADVQLIYTSVCASLLEVLSENRE
jgi:hypothetical protein